MSREVWNLLEEFNYLENDIRKSMMPDEKEIFKGINVVREIVKELNLEIVNSEFRDKVRLTVDKYMKESNSQMKIINNYMLYGISRCLLIIDGVIRSKDMNCKVLKRSNSIINND